MECIALVVRYPLQWVTIPGWSIRASLLDIICLFAFKRLTQTDCTVHALRTYLEIHYYNPVVRFMLILTLRKSNVIPTLVQSVVHESDHIHCAVVCKLVSQDLACIVIMRMGMFALYLSM